MVSKDKILVDQSKVEAIEQWPLPKTLFEVRSFYGLASFYHFFIPYFTTMMTLLRIACDTGNSVGQMKSQRLFV